MRRQFRKPSDKLITQLKAINYWRRGLNRALYGSQQFFRVEGSKGAIVETASLFTWDIHKKVDDVFAVEIGRAMVNEQ